MREEGLISGHRLARTKGMIMPLVGMGHDAMRSRSPVFEGRNDFAHIVAVDLGDLPIESFKLRTKRREIVGFS